MKKSGLKTCFYYVPIVECSNKNWETESAKKADMKISVREEEKRSWL